MLLFEQKQYLQIDNAESSMQRKTSPFKMMTV